VAGPFLLLLASRSLGQITIPASTPVGERIAATIALPPGIVPEGAILKGVVPRVRGCQWDYGPSPHIIHVWGKPGTYAIDVTAQWGLKHPTTPDAWSDFGIVGFEADFKITGGTGPDPPDPPLPGGKYRIVLWYSEDQVDNLPQGQRDILLSRTFREWLASEGHNLLEELDPANFQAGSVPEQWQPWLSSIKNDPLPRIAIAPLKDAGPIADFALPADIPAAKAFLRSPAARKAVTR
jgi:hypothetical protein